MHQLLQPLRSFAWLPPGRIVGLICLYIIGISLAAPVFQYFSGVSDESIENFILPILEESLKFWLAFRFSEHVFGAIVTFGILELLMVKVPGLFEAQGMDELLLGAVASLIVLTFHAATASAYKAAIGSRAPYVMFGLCVAFHILLNAMSVFIIHYVFWGLSALLISASVFAAGRLVARTNRP